MAKVFLSYHRGDAGKAQAIAAALENAGHDVWWDRHIKGGAKYSKEIDKALKQADAVVVLWSERSVESDWVRDEATAGRDSGRFVPVSLDSAEPPLGFRQYQTIDLSRWRGKGRPPELPTLLAAIEAVGDEQTSPEARRPIRKFAPRFCHWSGLLLNWWLIIGILVVLLGLAISKPWEANASVPIVAVRPSDGSAAVLARDLTVQLGSLEMAKSGSLQLVGAASTREPDLLFEASARSSAPIVGASLVLMIPKNGAILWSKDFEQPANRAADLREQLAFTAARVLDCALEAIGAPNRLSPEFVTLYLNGCASVAELKGVDVQTVIPIFREVTRRAPQFEGGWAKLLVYETYIAALYFEPDSKPAADALRGDLAAARGRFPDLAEAYDAEAILLPATAYADQLKLFDRAIQANDGSAIVRAHHSKALETVGRMNDAVRATKRAAELDPLSPAIRNDHILALFHAGQREAAHRELESAERLWPGTSSMKDARFRLTVIEGDPKEGLRQLANTNGNSEIEAFLRARMEPTQKNIDHSLAVYRSARHVTMGTYSQALAIFGRHDELFRDLMNWRGEEQQKRFVGVLFRPMFRTFRQKPRFMLVAKRFGLVDYWQKTGNWPDFCFEPDLPYDCKAEAAKLS